MDSFPDFDCSICLEVCNEAVESTCCGSLFCLNCTSGIKGCPTCRAEPFSTMPNRFARKCIGRMKIACDKCGLFLQRDSLTDHMRVCEMRELQCAARECVFTGVKRDLLEHVVVSHEEDILTVAQRLDRPHVFQPSTADHSVQTTTETTDSAVQTTLQSSDVINQDSSDYTPTEATNGKYYCGRLLHSICPCKNYYKSDTSRNIELYKNFGCQGGRCGPEGGHNCADCMRLDLVARNMPLQGYCAGRTRIINLRAEPTTCLIVDNIRICYV